MFLYQHRILVIGSLTHLPQGKSAEPEAGANIWNTRLLTVSYWQQGYLAFRSTKNAYLACALHWFIQRTDRHYCDWLPPKCPVPLVLVKYNVVFPKYHWLTLVALREIQRHVFPRIDAKGKNIADEATHDILGTLCASHHTIIRYAQPFSWVCSATYLTSSTFAELSRTSDSQQWIGGPQSGKST